MTMALAPTATPGPVFKPIGYSEPFSPCDGHLGVEIRALVTVTLPSGGTLALCGHCARRRLGYEHIAFAKPENRTKG